jgi:E3 ubiquitin-protein ligase HUWE1
LVKKKIFVLFVTSTFRWALSNGLTIHVEEGLEHPDLIDGTGEFLDAWLMLLEKMVNPKAILDSPHTITMKHGAIYKPFDPLKYLMTIHKVSTLFLVSFT